MIKYLVRFKIPVSILFFVCQFLWIQSKANLLDLKTLSLTAIMSFFFLFGFWLFLLLDMINSRIYNKTFWLISMLIMPWLAPAIYLFQRKKLQHLKSTPFNKA